MEEKENKKITVNQQLKAKVFENLFSDKKNLLKLFKEIDPEDYKDYLTTNDIKFISTANVFKKSLKNDVAFQVEDELILATEAQTLFKDNDILRFSSYGFILLSNYVISLGQKIHKSKKLKVPRIKIYVLYSGNQKNLKSSYSLRETFFEGEAGMPDIEVKLIFADEKVTGGIVNQFLLFCKAESELIKGKHFKVNKEDFLEFINNCIEKGILSEYLSTHHKEVEGMFEEMTFEQYLEIAKEEGRIEGKEEGLIEGKEEGELIGTIRTLKNVGREKRAVADWIREQFNLDSKATERCLEAYWDN